MCVCVCVCVCVCLTVSLSSPNVSALWPNRTSAVSWKHVTHWLSPKSAKLAWESDRQGCRGVGYEIMYVWARKRRYFSCICIKQALMMCTVCTYREQESVFEVWVLSVTLLAAVQSVVLVYNFLVAVCRRTGRVQTVLLSSVHHRRYAAEILRLGREKENGRSEKHQITWNWCNLNSFFNFQLSLSDRTGLRYDRKWDEGGATIRSRGPQVGLEAWAAVARTATCWWISSACRFKENSLNM